MEYPNKSHRHTEEFKAEHSKRMSGEGNPFFGREHTSETITAISRKLKGKSKGSIPRLAKYGVTEEQYQREIASGKRWCCHGKHFVQLSEFAPRFQKKVQGGVCRPCEPLESRRRVLRARYDVTPEWYDEKLAEQDGGCAICKCPLALTNKKFLAIDHDHKTGKARGVLCARCNIGLSRFEEIDDWATKALAYLAVYAVAA